MPVGESSALRFTSSDAGDVLTRACAILGLASEGAELLRLGENAIFRLRDKPLVVRIGRSLDRLPIMARELCVARWLDHEGVPVARVYDGVAEPAVVGQHPVSVWHLVATGTRRPGARDLALLLRQVHALNRSPSELPELDPLVNVEQRLHAAVSIDIADRQFLIGRCEQLRASFKELEFALPPGPVHGDAHIGNLLGEAGNAVLTDFESAAIGPREYDLVALAVGRARFGLPAQTYHEFVQSYGFDVMSWSGFGVLRDMRELGMTASGSPKTWPRAPPWPTKSPLRIRSIRNSDTAEEWHVF